MHIGKTILAPLLGTMILSACSDDDNGARYPSVFTEMADIISNSQAITDELLDDYDHSYPLANNLTGLKLEANDTARCICIFERNENNTIKLYSCQKIVAPHPEKPSKFTKGIKRDSIFFHSIWRSGHYVNLHLQVLGKDQAHYLHLIEDTLMANPDGTHTLYVELYHDQNNDMKAFRRDAFVSVPLRRYEQRGVMKKGDTVSITANTYDRGRQTWKMEY